MLSKGHGQQCVIVVYQEAFVAHRSAIPAAPIVRAPQSTSAFEPALVVLAEHRKQDSIGFLPSSEIVEGRKGKERETPGCAAILVVLKAIGVVGSYAAAVMAIRIFVHIILERNRNKVAGQSHVELVAARAPAGWEKMNLQVVLECTMVGTTPGSPKIVDVYFWK